MGFSFPQVAGPQIVDFRFSAIYGLAEMSTRNLLQHNDDDIVRMYSNNMQRAH